MDRRSFFKALAGVVMLPSAALPFTKREVSYRVTFKAGPAPEATMRVRMPIEPVPGAKQITEATIGAYADYVSMQWDVGNGYLDLGDIPYKKMGRLR